MEFNDGLYLIYWSVLLSAIYMTNFSLVDDLLLVDYEASFDAVVPSLSSNPTPYHSASPSRSDVIPLLPAFLMPASICLWYDIFLSR